MTRQTSRRIMACLVPAMVLPTVASLVYYVWWAGTPAATAIYTATKLFTVVWPIVAVGLIQRDWPRWQGVCWGVHLKALPLGLITGSAIGGTMFLLMAFTPAGDYVAGSSEVITHKVGQMGLTTPGRYVVFCVFLAVLHSLIEEFFWRWYVFGRLARAIPAWCAHLLAGLAFAGHHYVVLGSDFDFLPTLLFGTGVGVGGVIWSVMLRRQGSLAGCWLSHAVVDGAIFTIGYRLIFN